MTDITRDHEKALDCVESILKATGQKVFELGLAPEPDEILYVLTSQGRMCWCDADGTPVGLDSTADYACFIPRVDKVPMFDEEALEVIAGGVLSSLEESSLGMTTGEILEVSNVVMSKIGSLTKYPDE